jgi:hypothetical protein
MKTFIILININHTHARNACNAIENTTFANFDALEQALVKNGIDANEDYRTLKYEISDFMEAVNSQELDVLTEYFLSYVKIEG